ncbi:urea ABC transporter permease subunit UrtC [Atrimonas thermophila]|uniref:urea ABC transporter permease subunit UrtC n=1 Tax=Atrimonas thermophila TaxID=3064161 RepID=UPI00399CDB91
MLRRRVIFWVLGLSLLFGAPYFLSSYDLSLLGRFLALSLVTIGIVWSWGYTGILSLGQGVFFGLGAYALAMHLKLAELPPGELPDFMIWNGVSNLPWWWLPFRNPFFAFAMVIILPGILALLLSFLLFRRRITGVYVSLITQALALAFSTLLISQQGLTGGFNGLTNFTTLLGFYLWSDQFQRGLYWFTVAFVVGILCFSFWLRSTHLGKLLVAIRDGENRVRFLGYDPTPYKVFAFTLSGVLAGIGGALFVLYAGVISPAMVGVVPSIEMVVWAAVGGRESLFGALLGTVLGNLIKDRVSSAFPDIWLYLVGFLFILVVFRPSGSFLGYFQRLTLRQRSKKKEEVFGDVSP